jgi:UDP-N-acetylglucosamine transferase subunit ALG13
MIFVTVGTNEAPFDRLLKAVAGLVLEEELVVQRGSSAVPIPHARCFESLPFEELLDYARAARVVIAHAGVGSVLALVSAGKRPIVLPRLHRFREAVDDHQLEFGRRLAAAGPIQLVEHEWQLADALSHTTAAAPPPWRADGRLARELRDYLIVRLDGSGTGTEK